jgi:hypothetical protein
LIVGGITPSWMERARIAVSRPPAAPSRCPVMDFVEDTATLFACAPKTCLIARVSTLSPVGVEVPWALMYEIFSGAMPASSRAARITRAGPSPSSDGAAMWYASPESPYPTSSA